VKANFDLVCLSHLRWDFVYQRPQHLLSRCVKSHRVFFVEEPVFGQTDARLDVSLRENGVIVVVPHLPEGSKGEVVDSLQRELLSDFFEERKIDEYVLWYYTPMALAFTDSLSPLAVVYDCMDELSAFRGAPLVLRERERELLERADIVFTGGQSLYEAKRHLHPAVFAFPSSVDTSHFAAARMIDSEPDDQQAIPHPRIGFYGVIDERLDLELLGAVAKLKPDWHWIIIGPVVKIDSGTLPSNDNIHYLGSKSYADLPAYLASWDVAMMPFALNESTRFISPTKTPEYLAGGKPVVSTSIRDVVRPYQDLELVRIADTPEDFVAAVDAALVEDPVLRNERTEQFLASNSWDKTWNQMESVIADVISKPKVIEKEYYSV
jgi:glycosyltransferase involved in cell wall biosynthesis